MSSLVIRMSGDRRRRGWPARATVGALTCLMFAAASAPAVEAAPAAGAAPATDGAGAADFPRPSAAIEALLTATPPPRPLLHAASGRVALLYLEAVIDLERLARPRLGLAGYRFDPVSRTSDVAPLVRYVEIVDAAGDAAATGQEPVALWRPADGALLDDVRFAPDGERLSAVRIGQGPAKLALFDIASGRETVLDAPVNTAWPEPCDWVDAGRLLCRLVPDLPGEPPADRPVPIALDHEGGPEPVRTYANLLRTTLDDERFDYWFGAELGWVDVDGGVRRIPGSAGQLADVDPSPDGAYAVVTRLLRPYPRLVRAARFPSSVEIWNLAEARVLYASGTAGFGVAPSRDDGVRRFVWKPGTPVTLGGIVEDHGEDGARRWCLRSISAPYEGETELVACSSRSMKAFGWTTAGTPFFTTRGDGESTVRVFVVLDGQAREIWQASTSDRYGNPGRALRRNGDRGPVLESGGRIFLAGDGLGPAGPRPFLDAFDLASGATERLFAAEEGTFEVVLGLLAEDGSALLTSRETETSAPELARISDGQRRVLRARPSPYPALDAVERRVLHYERRDGVALSATLYLPAGYREGTRLPTLVWIYPYEYDDPEQAGQLDVRAFRYHQVKGPSPLAAVLAGYAVLVNPTMPIVLDDEHGEDGYLGQLVASAEAAVDHLAAIGVTDPDRVAVGGRSYGAFSAANLLIHSERFATAISMSGAYNRTLTPFGFQREKRSFWQATDYYTKVSPFFHADRVRRPILLVHGGGDENPGTPVVQTRRFFHALVGEGARVRYVELPMEGHHYWARENVLAAAAELVAWLDATIGGARSASLPSR